MRRSKGRDLNILLSRLWIARLLCIGLAVGSAWGLIQSFKFRPTSDAVLPLYLQQTGTASPLKQTQGPSDLQAAQALARSTARVAPLSAYPYGVQTIAAAFKGETALADRLLARTLRMDPRSSTLHVFAMNDCLRRNDIQGALLHAVSLHRLNDELGPMLAAMIASLAADAALRPTVAKAIAGLPLRDDVIRTLQAEGASPAIVFDLLKRTEAIAATPTRAQLAAGIAELYLARKNYGGARAVWRTGLSDPRLADQLIQDRSFQNMQSGGPFGWQVSNNADLQVHVQKVDREDIPTALLVEVYAPQQAPAARQVLTAPPGSYRLSYVAKDGGSPAGTSALQWDVQCHSDGKSIGTFAVVPSGSWSRQSHELVIPTGCEGQVLTLSTRPNFVTTRTWVSNITLEPSDALPLTRQGRARSQR